MSTNYVITTDSSCDLPRLYTEELNLEKISLSFTMGDVTTKNDDDVDYKKFYADMRGGATSVTGQVMPEDCRVLFEKHLSQGVNVLHIAFSSGLSGSCNSSMIAAKEINEEYTDVKVAVVDSLCASLGQGLIVHHAIELKKSGKSMQEVIDWLESKKQTFCHYFTVGDLKYLHRGGRVSKTTAVVGGILGIKPILRVDEEGKLVAVGKARGRKASIDALFDAIKEKIVIKQNGGTVFISHGDCYDDAAELEARIKKDLGVKNVTVGYIGPVIGSHAGPDTIAVFFRGKDRSV